MFYINNPETINAICEAAKERNTVLVFNDIVIHTKAFQGDVFGEFVRDWRVSNVINTCSDIDIRLEIASLVPFLNILGMRYDIVSTNHLKDYVPQYYFSYIITNKVSSFKFVPIKLGIHTMTKRTFKSTFSDFDVNLFSEDDTCLYLRNTPPSIRFCMDKINVIKDRACKKKFCAIEPFYPHLPTKQVASMIESAIKMVSNDWFMDDFFLKDKSWIVARWSNVCTRPLEIRQTVDIKRNDECCLCQEKFKTDDIIINTVCNHNYHWSCGDNNGLVQWVKTQGKLSCPFCRNNMF